jgi:hypothetical protein
MQPCVKGCRAAVVEAAERTGLAPRRVARLEPMGADTLSELSVARERYSTQRGSLREIKTAILHRRSYWRRHGRVVHDITNALSGLGRYPQSLTLFP